MTIDEISKLIKIKLLSKDITEEDTELINGEFTGVLELVAKAHFDDVKLPEDIPLLEREFAKMIYEVLYQKAPARGARRATFRRNERLVRVRTSTSTNSKK